MSIHLVDFGAFDKQDNASIDALANELDSALSAHGFVALANLHAVPRSLRTRAFDLAAEFFASDSAKKAPYLYRSADDNFGYQGPFAEALDPEAPGDLKETFTMRNLLHRPHSHSDWPGREFEQISRAMYAACFKAARQVLTIFARALDVPDDFFNRKHDGQNTSLRYLYYPAALVGERQAQMGAGAHTDYGSITLLFQDAIGGLQLRQDDGSWLDFEPIDGAAVLNTGDLMAHWSNNRYPSTIHRVLPRSGVADRQSIAFFVDPDSDVNVQCLASCTSAQHPAMFTDTTAGAHIQSKIEATHKTGA